MAKVTAPLLGFSASGAVGKTLVYGKWKGVPYARQHVIPANPRSTGQTNTRSIFSFLSSVWKVSPADFRTSWTLAAKGRPLTDRNKFMGDNVRILKPGATTVGMEFSPGAAGGLPINATVSGGVGDITIDGVAPAVLPAGWTITRFIGAAISDTDPHMSTLYDVAIGQDDTAPYSVVLAGLTAGDYSAAGWFEYQRSTLATDLAYGAAFGQAVTVT